MTLKLISHKVYCIEQNDQSADVNDLRLKENGKIREEWAETVGGGVMLLVAAAEVLSVPEANAPLYVDVEISESESPQTELTALRSWCSSKTV